MGFISQLSFGEVEVVLVIRVLPEARVWVESLEVVSGGLWFEGGDEKEYEIE